MSKTDDTNQTADRLPTPKEGELSWGVREDGNYAILEFRCSDAYGAIELAEIMSRGMEEGSLEISVRGAVING